MRARYILRTIKENPFFSLFVFTTISMIMQVHVEVTTNDTKYNTINIYEIVLLRTETQVRN